MYEIRTFYLTEGIKVSDLLSLLKSVCDRFLTDSASKKEAIESFRSAINRALEHSFALYHEIISKTPKGVYYEFGLMNVEGLGIVSAIILQSDENSKMVSIVPMDLKIDGFAIHSTIPSWRSRFQGNEQKKVFDDLVLLITSELAKIPVNIMEIKSESKWGKNLKENAGLYESSIFFIKIILFLWTNIFIV